MKKILLGLIFVFAFCISACAAPFLSCDPYPATAALPTSFVLIIDGGSPIETGVQINADGSVQLHYDLGTISVGSHTVTVQAKNLWGVSLASTPFQFTRPTDALVNVTNINLSAK
jgi:hypothetical protein